MKEKDLPIDLTKRGINPGGDLRDVGLLRLLYSRGQESNRG